MKTTKIEWTERTWNPVTGCTKISPGCQNCYAEMMSRRLKAMGNKKYEFGFTSTIHPEELEEPFSWIHSSLVFVCSMSDLFHKDVPFSFIDEVMSTIERTPQHTYQILTKRAERMEEYFSSRRVPDNAWIGVTIESAELKHRLDNLKRIDAHIRFISFEPLIGDIGEIDLNDIHWVIVGGESGVSARPMQEAWAMNIKAHAEKYNVPFFFKQWGTWGADGIKRNKKANGKKLAGKTYLQMPLYKFSPFT